MNSTNPLMVAPREVVVDLYPGDVEQQLNDLFAALDVAEADEAAGQARMGVESRASAIAQQIDDLVATTAERVVKVRLREVAHEQLLRIRDANPPREDNKRDEAAGVDQDGYYRAAIAGAIVEPEVTPAQFREFADSVGRYNWSKLVGALESLAVTDVDLPKSSAVSLLARRRENASKRRERTE